MKTAKFAKFFGSPLAMAAALALTNCAPMADKDAAPLRPTGGIDAMAAEPQAQDVLAISERVARWQLAHMDDYDSFIRNVSRETPNRRGWVQGTFFLGLQALSNQSADPVFDDALLRYMRGNGWRLGDRPLHADDHLVGLIYARMVANDVVGATLAPTIAGFEAILADPPSTSLDFGPGPESPCSVRWCWSDALFMAPATWFAVEGATDDERFGTYAHHEYRATVDLLFDQDESLFFRDTRFVNQRGPDGENLYWSRGNGWVYGGLVNILRELPENDRRRAYYVDLFRQMSDRLVALQGANGMWKPSLTAIRNTPPETSGTGFFVNGLAWGVNNGVLTDPTYRRAALAGWDALTKQVSREGRLGYVQQVGDRPDAVLADDTQFYGSGAFMLAASEIYQLASGGD